MRDGHHALHREIRALRRTRDQLERLAHPGLGAAKGLWEELAERLSAVEKRAKQLRSESADPRGAVADGIREDITELRENYDRLASALREPGSDGPWGPVRNGLDGLACGYARSAEDTYAGEWCSDDAFGGSHPLDDEARPASATA